LRRKSTGQLILAMPFVVFNGDETSLRIVRERGQIFIDLASRNRDWISVDEFLERHKMHPDPGTSLDALRIIALLCERADDIRRAFKQA
jgi:hypothetical protein